MVLMVTGGSLIPSTQLPSHGAGQTLPVNSGKLLVCSRRYRASCHRPLCTRSFHSGIKLPSGQPIHHRVVGPHEKHLQDCADSMGSFGCLHTCMFAVTCLWVYSHIGISALLHAPALAPHAGLYIAACRTHAVLLPHKTQFMPDTQGTTCTCTWRTFSYKHGTMKRKPARHHTAYHHPRGHTTARPVFRLLYHDQRKAKGHQKTTVTTALPETVDNVV